MFIEKLWGQLKW